MIVYILVSCLAIVSHVLFLHDRDGRALSLCREGTHVVCESDNNGQGKQKPEVMQNAAMSTFSDAVGIQTHWRFRK